MIIINLITTAINLIIITGITIITMAIIYNNVGGFGKNDEKKPVFNVIGVGPGDTELITVKAIKAIKNSDFIFYPEVSYLNTSLSIDIIKDYIDIQKDRLIPLEIEMKKSFERNMDLYRENALKIIAKLKEGGVCSYITVGDPSFYSTYAGLYTALKNEPDFEATGAKINIIPGISSLNYAFGLLKDSYITKKSSVLISVPVNKDSFEINSEIEFLYKKKERPQVIVFMKAGNYVKNILEVFRKLYYNEFKEGKLKLYLIEKSEIIEDFCKTDIYTGKKESFDYFSILISIFL